MDRYEVEVESEEDIAECPECEGTGKLPDLWEHDEETGERLWRMDCKVCSGFGRLDW